MIELSPEMEKVLRDGAREWNEKQQRARHNGNGASADSKQRPFATSVWPDPATLPPRQWLYGRHYLRGSIGCTVAHGATGKTSLSIAEAVAMATGRNLLGVPVPKRLRVLYWNGEEPFAEIQKRVYAVCQHYQIDRAELVGWLFISSGTEKPINVNNSGHNGLIEVEWFLRDHKEQLALIDVVIIDPFVASHSVPENDNTLINVVARQWAALASKQQVSVDLVHHTRKPPAGGEITNTTHDARGAVALVDAARMVRVLNKMTDAEAARANVEQPYAYFRADPGKANYAPAEVATWFHLTSVIIANGDDVGAVVTWRFPGAFDGVSAVHMEQVRERAACGTYRADPRSDEWIGMVVADVLHLDPEGDAKRIKAILKTWFANGALRKVDRMDAGRRPRAFVEPGDFDTGCSSS